MTGIQYESLDDVWFRLHALERQAVRRTRMTRCLVLGVVVALGVLVCAGQSSQPVVATPSDSAREIRASRVVIVDDEGRPRIALGLSAEHAAAIAFFNQAGKERMRVSHTSEGVSGIGMQDSTGANRVLLMSDDHGASLAFSDRSHKTRINLATFETSNGLALCDESGTWRVRVGAADNGLTGMYVADKNAEPRAILGAMNIDLPGRRPIHRPESSIVLFGEDQKVWQQP